MNNYFTLLLIAITLTFNSFSQTPMYQWAKGAGSTDVDNAVDNCTDTNGNLFIVGYFKGVNINFGTGPLINSASSLEEAYIVKYDSMGTTLWSKSFGSTSNDRATGVRTDALGNVYVTGNFSGPTMVIGTTTLSNASATNQAFIVKYNPLGAVVWAKAVTNNVNGILTSVGIATDASGNSYITGTTSTPSLTIGTFTINNMGYYLAKFDALGNVVWATQGVSGTQPVSAAIALDGSGNLYVTGNYVGPSCTFGSATLSNSSTTTNDVFLAKYNTTTGNVIWATSGNGTGDDIATCVTVDNAGFVIVGGSFASGSFTFGGNTITNMGGQDAYIARYNSSGTGVLLTSNNAGVNNDRVQKLTTDVAGKIYASGYAYSGTFGFPGVLSFNNMGGPTYCDAFIVKYDPATTGKWVLQVSGNNFNDIAWCITSSPGGNIYIAGSFEANFIALGSTNINNVSTGTRDIFVARLYNCLSAPAQPNAIAGNTTTCTGSLETYSISSMVGVTGYTWTKPAGWTGTSTTNILNTASGTSGNIGITLQNSCGISTIKNVSVTVNPLPTLTITSSNTFVCSGQMFTLTATGANNYTWTAPSYFGFGFVSLTTSNTITTTYTIVGEDATTGCKNSATITQSVSACTSVLSNVAETLQISTYPNPFNSTFTVQLNTSGIPFKIDVYNSIGQLVHSETTDKEKTEINLNQLPSGIYFVKINSSFTKAIKK